MRLVLSLKDRRELLGLREVELPKYSGSVIDTCNQWAQSTRPKNVGQMSELIQEFPGRTFEEWEKWYRERKPGAIERAAEQTWRMFERVRGTLEKVDKETIREWIEDLVLVKTFLGLAYQQVILAAVAEVRDADYRLARPNEESQGIDGFIGGKAVSIKPATYEAKNLPENIECELITYEKRDDTLIVECRDDTL